MKKPINYGQNLATLILVSGLLLSSMTVARAEAIGYEQSPGHFGGFSSDGAIFMVADEFLLSQAISITNITWWGGYSSPHLPIPSTDDFTIRLFDDDSGQPGALIQTFAVGNNASRTATGDYVNPPDETFEGRPEFQYSFDLPTAFQVDENTRYWLSIVNEPSSDSWVWEVSGSLTNLGVQRSFQSGPWEPYFDNTAFRLETSGGVQPLSVTIDIKPESFPNIINPNSRGQLPVAILSNPTFDASSEVNKTSLTFGRIGNEPSLVTGSCQKEDVNRDRLPDLLCKFSMQATGFQIGTTLGKLRGLSITGVPLHGSDSIQTVSYP